MRTFLLTLTLLTAGSGLAQTPDSAPKQAPAPRYVFRGYQCPVDMAAQQQEALTSQGIRSVEDTQHGNQNGFQLNMPSRGVHVELNAPKDKAIVQAQVEVFYTIPTGGVMRVDGSPIDTGVLPILKKTFHLTAGGSVVAPNASVSDIAALPSMQQLAGNLLVGRNAVVTRVRTLSIIYSDGSLWQQVKDSPCSVTISRWLPVTSHN